MLYPLVLVAMKKFMPVKVMKACILVATVLSFILCIIASNKWPTAAYYLLPARAWEMMLGGLAFLYPLQLKAERKKVLSIFGFIIGDQQLRFGFKRKYLARLLGIVPALGTFFIIIAHRDDSRLMNNAVFQKLGTWSYSIYLWHWPLVVFMNSYLIDNTKNILLLILLSLLLGMISYKLIEKKVSGYITAVLLLTTLGAAFTVNIYDGNFDLRAKSQGTDNQFIETYKIMKWIPPVYFLKCNASYRILKTKKPKVGNDCISSEQGGIFLWGDSHIGSISTGLKKSLGDSMPFNLLTSSGCAPSFVAS
ncbi:acyltransferase family protein [Pseudoalteromonas espejiana]